MSHKKRNKHNKHHRHSKPHQSNKVVEEKEVLKHVKPSVPTEVEDMIHPVQFTPISSTERALEEEKSESDSLFTTKLFKLIVRGFYRERDILLHSTVIPTVGWLENACILFISSCTILFLWGKISGMDIFDHSKFVFIIDMICAYLVVTRIAYHLRKYFASKPAQSF